MFTGLSAFPLSPLHNDLLDEKAYKNLIEHLAAAGVDSITALGSTGSYAYLSREERRRVAQSAAEHAGDVPVFVGIGALRTSQVLAHADDAAQAGASALLLAPVSYQALTENDVFELFRAVTEHTELPVIVYDNPGTTHFTFTTDLYARIAGLSGIASIKIPALPSNSAEARKRVQDIRSAIPENVTIGISGDQSAVGGLEAGCDAWYSVIGGTLPELAVRLTRLVQAGDANEATEESARLARLWELNTEFGSLRVVAAIAEYLGLAPQKCLPLPIQGLNEQQRARVNRVVDQLDLP
ncbi:dihydrodipicolinate synthase family protein [Kocuria sp. cx-116]|uniref:dihydrodipicolinate synthase family protein n=1 Tax=Kocuria sp. cx-116 TaxID=2771378 RepID=UPI00168A1A3B|nr:dihydrodipicolinate synthase family protein [Kocuria sp. cx-116]MBD2763123.1 dihydrodipicolinate synthase family protein [Kocuria sp. cx-116]